MLLVMLVSYSYIKITTTVVSRDF